MTTVKIDNFTWRSQDTRYSHIFIHGISHDSEPCSYILDLIKNGHFTKIICEDAIILNQISSLMNDSYESKCIQEFLGYHDSRSLKILREQLDKVIKKYNHIISDTVFNIQSAKEFYDVFRTFNSKSDKFKIDNLEGDYKITQKAERHFLETKMQRIYKNEQYNLFYEEIHNNSMCFYKQGDVLRTFLTGALTFSNKSIVLSNDPSFILEKRNEYWCKSIIKNHLIKINNGNTLILVGCQHLNFKQKNNLIELLAENGIVFKNDYLQKQINDLPIFISNLNEKINLLKIKGNEYFKMNNYSQALNQYHNAIIDLCVILPIGDTYITELNTLLILLNNYLLCLIRLNQYEKAIKFYRYTIKTFVEMYGHVVDKNLQEKSIYLSKKYCS